MSYKCACYAYLNLYLKEYPYHFRYFSHEKFLEDYQQFLTGQKHSKEEINEISKKLKELQATRLADDSKAFERLKLIRSKYTPLHPKIFTFSESWLEKSFVDLVNSCRRGEKAAMEKVRQATSDEVDVYVFRVFKMDFISLLKEELEHVNRFEGIQLGRPNTMNHNGVLMQELGMDSFITKLREDYLQPLVDVAFGDTIGKCDSHRGFSVRYSYKGEIFDGTGDKKLGKHYDNAEITLNVCLQADDCSGSELIFMGLATEEDNDRERLHVTHDVGQAILHLGRLRHYVTPIESGVRTNLVLWLRSSEVRNVECPMCWDVPEIVKTKCSDDGFRP